MTLAWRIARDIDGPARNALRALWEDDPQRNPFAAPQFLRTMQESVRNGAGQPLWTLGARADGSLGAAWPLSLTPSRRVTLAPVDYGDQRTCLARADVGATDLGDGLALAIRESRATSLAFANVPRWGPTLAAIDHALVQLGWPRRAFAAWPCPVLRVAAGPDAGAAFRAAIERHKRVRGYANALRRQPGFAFEIAERDDGTLARWHREFCDAHVARWRGTKTPSLYDSPWARDRWHRVLEAWHVDGVLVRFTIRTNDGALAMVAALRSNSRMIYYHVVTSPLGERHRAGHVLIRLMGLWMGERGFDTLDFGAGGEDYKSRYATGDDPLWRVFAAPRRVSIPYMRGWVEERIRGSSMLQRTWDGLVNRGLRGSRPARRAGAATPRDDGADS